MSKFFVRSNQISENIIEIVGEDVNHIRNVLRYSVNDEIVVCNQDEHVSYLCNIIGLTNYAVKCNILNKIEDAIEGNVKLHIFQGLPKADKMELILQKGTELGVSKFIPVKLSRCIVKLDGKDEEKKIERWKKITEVAAKQCGRDLIPAVDKVLNVKQICEIVNNYDLFLVAYECERDYSIKSALQGLKEKFSNEKIYNIAVLIGPEGGLDEKEVTELKANGAKVVSLGKRILRTETVALQVSSIIMYELENNN